MAQIGDKYIIEIGSEFKNKGGGFGEPLYLIKGFRSLVFDNNGLWKLQKYMPVDEKTIYKQGAEDAKEALLKLIQYRFVDESEDILDLIEEYKGKTEFVVGDEYESNDGTKLVVLDIDANSVSFLSENAVCEVLPMPITGLKKTSRHFNDVNRLIAKMRVRVFGPNGEVL